MRRGMHHGDEYWVAGSGWRGVMTSSLTTLGPASPIGPLPGTIDHARDRIVDHAVPMVALGAAAGAVVDGAASRAGMTGHGVVRGTARGAVFGALALGVPSVLHAAGSAGMQSLLQPGTERQANGAALLGTGLAGGLVGGVMYRNARVGVAGGAVVGAVTGVAIEFGLQRARAHLSS